MAKTSKITSTGKLLSVQKDKTAGKYLFRVESDGCGPLSTPPNRFRIYRFFLSESKALAIANAQTQFPLGVQIKVSGRVSNQQVPQLNHVNIVSVDGVETTAWSQRVGSTQVAPGVLDAAQQRIKDAEEAEEAMVNRAPPEVEGAITDPLEAYDNAMRIVRRQRRLKNPKLSQQEIWRIRDALNLLAEKLGIA
jgi:hypothetical protein